MDKIDFNDYWRAMNPKHEFDNRKQAAKDEWNKHPEKHQAIMAWLQKHGDYPERNPFFFIQDFTVPRPKGQPTNYRGQIIPQGLQVFSAKYNGAWGMYTLEDIRLYGLETPRN